MDWHTALLIASLQHSKQAKQRLKTLISALKTCEEEEVGLMEVYRDFLYCPLG